MSLFRNKYLWLMICFLVLQQCIVSVSNYWIVRLSQQLIGHQPFFWTLMFYFTSLILPYPVGGTAAIFLSKWEMASRRRIVERFLVQFKNKPFLWREKNSKEEITSFLSKESQGVISEITLFVYEFVASFLNVFLNLIAISIVIEKKFLLTFLIGLTLASALIKAFAKRIEALSAITLSSSASFTSILFQFWDNVVLGNSYNEEIWNDECNTKFSRLSVQTIRLSKIKQAVTIASTLALAFPTLFLIGYESFKADTDASYVLTLSVLIPRIFQIINSAYTLILLANHFREIRGKASEVRKILSRNDIVANPLSVLKFDEVKYSVNNSEYSRIPNPIDFIEFVKQSSHRITLRGPNGSGKSSLLLSIKDKTDGFLLPANNRLLFKDNSPSRSSGELMVKQLEEVLSSVETKVILLDEWDAHLDHSNIGKIDALLSRMKGVCIVEVRHR